jgi:alkylhydroperoxidase family enzyme
VPDAKIAAVASWAVSDCFDPLERAVLAYADALVFDRGRVDDVVFEALRGELSDEQILELTYIAATYAMHATISRALRLESDDVAEPVVEEAAPDGFDARRFAGTTTDPQDPPD